MKPGATAGVKKPGQLNVELGSHSCCIWFCYTFMEGVPASSAQWSMIVPACQVVFPIKSDIKGKQKKMKF